jgi:hypothetical protein
MQVSASPGLDIRPVGVDVSAGQKVLDKGAELGPAELGLLATVSVREPNSASPSCHSVNRGVYPSYLRWERRELV